MQNDSGPGVAHRPVGPAATPGVQYLPAFQYIEHMAEIEHPMGATADVIRKATTHLTRMGIDASWTTDSTIEGRITSGTLVVDAGSGAQRLPAVASADVSRAGLTLLPHDDRTILVTRHVSEDRASSIADRGWGGFVDSVGNASLRAPGVLVEITGRRAPVVNGRGTAASLTRAGLPVTFALLVSHENGLRLSQRDLAAATGSSIGTVNRVVRALRERTPRMVGPSNAVLRPRELEHEWVSAYSEMQPRAWPEERFTSDIWRSPMDLLDEHLPPGALLGSELAAAQLGAPIRPATALIHLPLTARPQLIRRGRLRRDDDGPIRIRPAFWEELLPGIVRTAPSPLLQADLLLEDDPRIDEIRKELFKSRH